MSRVFQLCGASVIIYNENRVLLQQRADSGCGGYHCGQVDLGEKVEDTAIRELYEETGLTANSLELFGVFSGPELYHRYPDGNEVYIIDVVYLCNDFDGTLKCQESEVLALEWFDIDKVPENISPPVKPGLKKFIEMKHLSSLSV